jgi:hypothetical protein
MRGILFVILNFLLVAITAQQYSNFIVQSDDSVSFLVELNGVQQLDTAHFDVKVENIDGQSHNVKLSLVGDSNVVVEKALFFQSMGVETTMKLVNVNGEYKLKNFGEVSMGAAPIFENQAMVTYKSGAGNRSMAETPDFENMSKVEVLSYELENGTTMDAYNTTLATSIEPTVFLTTTEEQTGNITDFTVNDSLVMDSVSNLLDSNKVYSEDVLNVVYNYNGEKGCSFPDFEVNELIAEINASPFSSQKIKVAKSGVRNQCLTTSQVEEIANTLEFEDNKLAFVKHAYKFTYDKQNYRSLLKLFNINSTKTDFLEFIKA